MRHLVARILSDDEESLLNILDILDYRQKRNHAAYCSHRKHTLERHGRKSKPKKRKVSE